MDRLEQLRHVIDEIVRSNPDKEEARCGFVHLYGVSAVCTILALKRGLDSELCAVAGMLHDIWNYQHSVHLEHGPLGSVEANKILHDLGCFSEAEISTICDAIALHGQKETTDGEMAELLKDADVFQHYLYNPQMYMAFQHSDARMLRLKKVKAELGIA